MSLDFLAERTLKINDKNLITVIERSDGLKSSSVKAGGDLNNKYAYNSSRGTPNRENISIALNWDKFKPLGTNSYSIIMEDVTEETEANGWIHWNLLNIPKTINSLAEDWSSSYSSNNTDGIKQLTADGSPMMIPSNQYVGPWPQNKHKYQVKIYALKSSMPIIQETDSSFNNGSFETSYSEHILDFRVLTFYYTP